MKTTPGVLKKIKSPSLMGEGDLGDEVDDKKDYVPCGRVIHRRRA